MHTPYYDAVVRAAGRGPRFFIPGHKGNGGALQALAPLAALDITEIDGVDDLSHPAGPLAQSEANMARAFGSGASLYSASGSTSCILAMLALFAGQGGQVVLARGCHVAVVRALALLDLTPHWVAVQGGVPQPEELDAALCRTGAKAVYITTVDYYGHIPDVAAIAAVCKTHGAALLCDNAHGAYLRFLPQSRHPLDLGADACADSAHKTMPCLTPAALLHLRNSALATQGRQMLNLFSSTSPPHPVLASLDLAAGLLLESPPDYAACANRLAQTAAGVAEMHVPCNDALRLHLRPALAGYDAAAFKQTLLENGIAAEYFDGDSLILMASPFNTEKDFTALEAALTATLRALPQTAALPGAAVAAPPWEALPFPEAVCCVRQAFFAEERETVATENAAGRVAAGLCAPCPPGVPLVLPGERVTPPHAAALAAGGILQIDVLK